MTSKLLQIQNTVGDTARFAYWIIPERRIAGEPVLKVWAESGCRAAELTFDDLLAMNPLWPAEEPQRDTNGGFRDELAVAWAGITYSDFAFVVYPAASDRVDTQDDAWARLPMHVPPWLARTWRKQRKESSSIRPGRPRLGGVP